MTTPEQTIAALREIADRLERANLRPDAQLFASLSLQPHANTEARPDIVRELAEALGLPDMTARQMGPGNWHATTRGKVGSIGVDAMATVPGPAGFVLGDRNMLRNGSRRQGDRVRDYYDQPGDWHYLATDAADELARRGRNPSTSDTAWLAACGMELNRDDFTFTSESNARGWNANLTLCSACVDVATAELGQ